MVLNLTLEHFTSAAFMIFLLIPFFKGERLLRVALWVFLWQLLTPLRDAHIDLVLFAGGFALLEITYLKARYSKLAVD